MLSTASNFQPQIDRLRLTKLLYQVIARFADIDLHPYKVSNTQMGYIYEELIRKSSELSEPLLRRAYEEA